MRAALRFEPDKISGWLALRNTAGVTLPLLVGLGAGQPGVALVVAIGALNVAFSDGDDTYGQRARRMLASCFLVATAVFCGAACGFWGAAAVLVAVVWAFGAGMLAALGPDAATLGVSSLATLLIFSGRPLSPHDAALAWLLAFGGGLLQTGLALALWPVRRYRLEHALLSELYARLAGMAAAPVDSSEPPPASEQSTRAQEAFAALGRSHSVESERCLLFLEQAERSRLCILTLARLRVRAQRQEPGGPAAEAIGRFLETASRIMGCIGDVLNKEACSDSAAWEGELQAIMDGFPAGGASDPVAALALDARTQMDALSRQLRVSLSLAQNATAAGSAAFARREAAQPWKLRIRGGAAILRANLDLRSAAFRHAVRLAVCVGLGDMLGRALGWGRPYWLPMTIAVVLKPDFTATFSRGVWRLLGTFAGLVFSTALFHWLSPSAGVEIALVAGAMFLFRLLGPAHYGILVTLITALVVLLNAVAGVDPHGVIAQRAMNTALGGTLALFAYWLWPTWERTQIAEAMAALLVAYRRYFNIMAQPTPDREAAALELDRARLAARLARSNMEASLDRLESEPGGAREQVQAYQAMLASSHAFAHSIIALEMGLDSPAAASEEFRAFSRDVERTLDILAARLRGRPGESPPDLREDHRRLMKSRAASARPHSLVNVETDRITNSVNTLREQVMRLA